MSSLSEQAFCAGWMERLEFDLWRAVTALIKRHGQRGATGMAGKPSDCGAERGEEVRVHMTHEKHRLVAVGNLQEFFRDALHSAMSHQKLAVHDHTEHYVVNLLTLFSRADALYERTAHGIRLKPLVVMLGEALEAPSAGERNRALQRLGDVSLFIAGFFAGSFARKLVDIDYHIAMGGRAYGSLADFMSRGSPFHNQTCRVCAAVCDACADACQKTGDPIMARCAEACRACSKSCQEMAAH